MEVSIKRISGWENVLDAARFTVNKPDLGKEPSCGFKTDVLMAEHSPIRSLIYVITIHDVPTWVSQHLARHDAFAGHNVREGASDTHYVATQRNDRTGEDRNKKPQDTPVNHRILLNAQDLITISRRRLCSCASAETRRLWNMIRDEVRKIDPEVANCMVRECVYRGFCPEISSCGFAGTSAYKKELEEYRTQKL